jgi:hypothetical protein
MQPVGYGGPAMQNCMRGVFFSPPRQTGGDRYHPFPDDPDRAVMAAAD